MFDDGDFYDYEHIEGSLDDDDLVAAQMEEEEGRPRNRGSKTQFDWFATTMTLILIAIAVTLCILFSH